MTRRSSRSWRGPSRWRAFSRRANWDLLAGRNHIHGFTASLLLLRKPARDRRPDRLYSEPALRKSGARGGIETTGTPR